MCGRKKEYFITTHDLEKYITCLKNVIDEVLKNCHKFTLECKIQQKQLFTNF